MMRVWLFLAALSVCLPAAAENVLMKSNGAGAAGIGMIGAAAAAAVLAPPAQWQGYPPEGGGDDGVHTPKADDSVNDWLRGGQSGTCIAAENAGLAKALKQDLPTELPPEGQIRLTDGKARTGKIYDPDKVDGGQRDNTTLPDAYCAWKR